MLTTRLALVIWAVVGPMLAAGLMRGREAVMVRAAVHATRIEQQSACNDRVAQVARAHDKEVDDEVDAALAAVAALSPTPTTPEGLRALCDRSASCRSRVRP